MSEYTKQATDFLSRNGLKFRATEYPTDAQDAPEWAVARDSKPIQTKAGPMTHGLRYRVTIWREGKSGKLAFDYWGSIASREAIAWAEHLGHGSLNSKERRALSESRPTAYDVLACISGDQNCADTFAEFCGDMGYDTDSISARKLWKRCSKFAKQIRAFFSESELTELAEIQ